MIAFSKSLFRIPIFNKKVLKVCDEFAPNKINDTSNCSGISKVEFKAQGGDFDKIVDVNSSNCNFTGSFSESKDGFNTDMNYINVVAFDKGCRQSSVPPLG